MFFAPAVVVTALAAAVSAHFQMQFPPPRGVFVMNNEPTFCDGYTNAVSNRSQFPLGQGFITLNSEHPMWTAAVTISLEQNPTNFSVFNQSTTGVKLPFVKNFFSATGEGLACIAIDIGVLAIPGVQSGSNVTIQVEFNGGDGNLFQCADLTLSDSFAIPSSDNCTNLVGGNTTTSTTNSTSNSTSASTSATGSSPAASSSTTHTSGALQLNIATTTGLMGAIGALLVTVL